MKHALAVLALAALAGCGIDGEPVAPTMNANVGVGPGGVSGAAGVTLRTGPLAASWGVGL